MCDQNKGKAETFGTIGATDRGIHSMPMGVGTRPAVFRCEKAREVSEVATRIHAAIEGVDLRVAFNALNAVIIQVDDQIRS